MIWEILNGGSNNGGNRTMGTELQTDYEHAKLQDPEYQFPDEWYIAQAMNDVPLMRALEQRAKEYELKYPRYWKSGDNFQRTPKPELTSSWVENVDYNPNTGLAVIRLNGSDYTYAGITPDQMERFLKSPSLGAVINASKDRNRKKGEPWVIHGLKV